MTKQEFSPASNDGDTPELRANMLAMSGGFVPYQADSREVMDHHTESFLEALGRASSRRSEQREDGIARARRLSHEVYRTTGAYPPPLFGFAGLKNSGKDTAAEYLTGAVQRRVPGAIRFVKQNIGRYLNDALVILDPIVEDRPLGVGAVRYSDIIAERGYEAAKEMPEVRRLQQVLGVDVARDYFDVDVWVRKAEEDIHRFRGSDRVGVASTSIRFPNEVEMIRRLGGVLIWIERPDTVTDRPDIIDAIDAAIKNHSSENSVKPEDCDYVLNNDGTIEELHAEVAFILDMLVN